MLYPFWSCFSGKLEERRSSSSSSNEKAAAFFFISFPTSNTEAEVAEAYQLRWAAISAAANFLFCFNFKWENIVYITAKSKSRCGSSCCYPWAGARWSPSSSSTRMSGIRPPPGPPSSSRHWVDPVKRGRVFVARIVAKRDWIWAAKTLLRHATKNESWLWGLWRSKPL